MNDPYKPVWKRLKEAENVRLNKTETDNNNLVRHDAQSHERARIRLWEF